MSADRIIAVILEDIENEQYKLKAHKSFDANMCTLERLIQLQRELSNAAYNPNDKDHYGAYRQFATRLPFIKQSVDSVVEYGKQRIALMLENSDLLTPCMRSYAEVANKYSGIIKSYAADLYHHDFQAFANTITVWEWMRWGISETGTSVCFVPKFIYPPKSDYPNPMVVTNYIRGHTKFVLLDMHQDGNYAITESRGMGEVS